MKLLFINLAWLNGNYDRKEQTIATGFSYTRDNPDSYVHECFNFKNIKGNYYAYVPRVNSLNIKKLGAKSSDKFVSDVSVVFISKDNINNQRKVIGYYEEAVVYKTLQKGPNKIDNININYLISSKKAVIFKEDERPIVANISSYKGSRGLFGQTPVWYPNLGKKNIKCIVDKILYNINLKPFSNSMSFEEYNKKLDNDTCISYYDDAQKRAERLKNAPKNPEKRQMITQQYLRNSDVRAEVLHRANGVCERCHCKAPFIAKATGIPYLEVHHKKPLSKGGKDTVENAIAVCPNCHREIHFG